MWPKDAKGVNRKCKSMNPFGIFWPHWVVCPSSIYTFWLPLWYLLATLCCLSFIDLHILITPLVSFGHIVLSVLHRFTHSDYLFGIFWPHWVVCPSSIYTFWLPLWHLLATLSCLSFIDLHILITPFTMWPKDAKGVIRMCKSMKDRQLNVAKRYQRGNQNV
jgi:hypothetical protein